MSYIKNPVVVLTRKITSKDKWLNVDYPVVVNMDNIEVQNKINSTIKNLVYELIKEQGYYDRPKVTVDGWYELKSNERGILSLTIGNYTFPYPSAHGLTVIKSLTFNIETGEVYQLSDLFKEGSDYVKVLSDIINVQIKARQIDLLDEFKGIAPDQDYYIADKCLVIYFQTYAIAPYVWGLPCFPISVFEIEDIVKDDGPLGVMIPM